MSNASPITASEFAATKQNLPESGRWHELHDGHPILLSAPDDQHGTIVLNLTRAMAQWFQTQPIQSRGYACPEIGIHVKSEPDTVYIPAISVFRDGVPFSQFDQAIADFSDRYADQNERDYEAFCAAITSGRLPAVEGL